MRQAISSFPIDFTLSFGKTPYLWERDDWQTVARGRRMFLSTHARESASPGEERSTT